MKKIIFAAVAAVIAIWFINLKSTSTVGSEVSFDSSHENFESLQTQESAREKSAVQVVDTGLQKHPKVTLLKSILETNNDNDPRLDSEFRNLSEEDKEALTSMYESMRPESLNDRGTIVFLMGREITRPEDAEFLKRVLSEEPCLSLSNCAIPNAARDPHMDSINDSTLSYPQLVALNRIKSFIGHNDLKNVNPSILSHLADAAKIGQNSRIPLVQARANEIISILEARN